MITITDFKALTAAQIKEQLPIDVTSDGQPLFTVQAATFTVPVPEPTPEPTPTPTPTPEPTVPPTVPVLGGYNLTRDLAVGLVLKARNEGNGDANHVNNARTLADSWLSGIEKLNNGTYQVTRDQLGRLVLAAWNDNGGDPAHVQSALQIADQFIQANLGGTPTTPPVLPPEAPTTPTTPETPTTPTTPVTPPTEAPASEVITKPHWLGDWSGNVEDAVKGIVKDGETALLVAYNIPHRDNGNYSAGGLKSAGEYANWIAGIARGIGNKKAIVVLEPDALGLAPGLANDDQRNERYTMLKNATAELKKNAGTRVFMDLSMWLGIENASNIIKKITGIDGFAINVSGYVGMQECLAFGEGVAQRTGLRYVIDTSRNGNGEAHPGKWCNMTDTKVGIQNTINPSANVAAYLWIKVPGESDGLGINDDGSHPRGDVPSAGTMWPEFRDAIYSGDWASFKRKYNV
jgi:endoglucanase